MADEIENDDQWLYGENDDNLPEISEEPPTTNSEEQSKDDVDDEVEKEAPEEEPIPDAEASEENMESNEPTEENETEKQNGEGSDKEDYEDSDDDVNVVIGDIKTSPTYTSLNIKRGGLLTSTSKTDKQQQPPQSGKFTVEEFDQPGTINGIVVGDFNLDSLEEKPWRKPGADITDYFNYGFNEDTWRAYCERQKRMRVNESGTGLLPLNAIGMPRGPIPIMNDNSKYSGTYSGLRKAGPPPGRRMAGSIDVIGGAPPRVGGPITKIEPPKENVIQVMTADRREYSRKPGFPDMSVPPPNSNFDDFHPEYDFNPEPEPFYGGYEPTQDVQWGSGNTNSWQPQEIKTLTGPPPAIAPVPPPVVPVPIAVAPVSGMPPPSPVPPENNLKPRSRSTEKDRERESVRREMSRDRERSHRRDRSRSRSHRHKSRSRSPGHRSHRKKKSRRHEDSE